MKALLRFVREEEGQDLIEYALLAGFISLAATLAITAVGGRSTRSTTPSNAQVRARTLRRPGSSGNDPG